MGETWQAVSAIASVVLCVLTGLYIRETHRLVKQSAPVPWIEPVRDVSRSGFSIGVQLRNGGAGHAVDVVVRMTARRKCANSSGAVRHEQPEDLILEGPSSLAPGDSHTFELAEHGVLSVDRPVITIEAISLTGNSAKWHWQEATDSSGLCRYKCISRSMG